MSTSFVRRSVANLRASLVIVAFTALAAVGLATTRSIRPVPTAPAGQAAVAAPHAAPSHAAPAACPMPAGVFRVR